MIPAIPTAETSPPLRILFVFAWLAGGGEDARQRAVGIGPDIGWTPGPLTEHPTRAIGHGRPAAGASSIHAQIQRHARIPFCSDNTKTIPKGKP